MEREKELRDNLRRVLGEASKGRDPLDLLSDIPILETFVDDYIQARIADARAGGASWSKVAERMGVSRQAVHRRFRGKGNRRAIIELRFTRDSRRKD